MTVQLYRYTQKQENSGEDVGDETIRLSLNTKWMDEDGNAEASSEDIPSDGNIVVKVTGNGKTYRAILNAANNWQAEVPGLPKYDSSKTLISYTAVIESVNKGTNILQVDDIGEPAVSFQESDKSVTINGRVKTKEDLNEDMEVVFDANWIDELNASATPSSDAEITAVITSSDGSSHTVHLNKSNNYTESVTLPRVAHGVAVTHTVSYTSSGTNVIQNDVSGLEEFGGDVSQIHVTGKMRKVVAPNKMNLVIDATGVISNDGNPWAVRLDASGTIHTSDWQKQKSFTPKKLDQDSPTAYANDLDLTEASGQTAVYYFSIAADHSNIRVWSDSGNVVATWNGNFYDVKVTALP